MKRASLTLVTILIFVFKLYSQASGIRFIDNLSWDQVKEKAKNENKPIFIDVYATWCGPCKDMDTRIYPQAAVGKVFNYQFISIKVQQDKSPKDNAFIQSWYKDAAAILKEYAVDAFPTYLFVSPEGKLMHREVGVHEAPEFIQIAELALTNPIGKYDPQLAAYQQGKKDYNTLDALILHVLKVRKNNQLAVKMAKDYKQNYLDKLPVAELLTKRHLDFLGEFPSLVSTKDQFFKLCYEHPAEVDKAKEYTEGGWAKYQVDQTVYREIIDPLLWKDEKNGIALTSNPDWKKIIKTVKDKYAKLDAEKMIEDAKLGYYHKSKNHQGFAGYVDSIIAQNIPQVNAPVWSAWRLNEVAWAMFTDTKDEQVLNAALKWIDLSISLEEASARSKDEIPNCQLYDTKANLLYKTGRVKEGIEWEEKALAFADMFAKKQGMEKSPFDEEYKKIIDKMKSGEPTWPVKDNTNPSK
jgi:thiol-disulfide isomerase/thioredoxin